MIEPEDVRTLVQSVRAVPGPSGFQLAPGAVSDLDRERRVASVVMDGDPLGTEIEARCLFADVSEEDRVMVAFDPPRGVFVVGTIGRVTEAGQTLLWWETDDVSLDVGEESSATIDVPLPEVSFRAGRLYRIDLTAQVVVCGVAATFQVAPWTWGSAAVDLANAYDPYATTMTGWTLLRPLENVVEGLVIRLNISEIVGAECSPGSVSGSVRVHVWDTGPVTAARIVGVAGS